MAATGEEKPTTQTDSLELIPPEGDEEVGVRVFEILRTILKDKEVLGIKDRSLRHHQLRKGEHWRNPSGDVPFVTANLIYKHIQREVNLLTDNNPIFNVAKMGDVSAEQEEKFEDMQKAAEHWWIDQEQQDVFETSVLQGEEYGVTIEHPVFNRELEHGLGEVEVIIVDPLHFGFYPPKMRACRDLQNREAILYYYPTTVRDLKRKYPEKAAEIKGDTELLKELGDERREVGAKPDGESTFYGKLISLANDIKQMLSFKTESEADEEETVAVECWVRDRSRENVYEENEATGEKKKIGTRPKYTGEIRRIIACNSGKVVLDDRDNPSINPSLRQEDAMKTYLYDKFPFYMGNSVKDTVNAWGMCDSDQLESLVMEFNKGLSQLTLMKDKAARIKIINPMTSGVDNSEFTNFPGIINPSNALEAKAISYLSPQVPIQDILASVELFRDLFYTIAGSFDLEQSNTPGKSVIAYKAIAALIEQASTMRKGKSRSYGRIIRERGRMYISYVQNFYTEKRWITYPEDGIEISKEIRGSDLIFPAKLTVVTGSTMPVSKVQKREEALAMFSANAVDLKYLHNALETPGRKELLQRMEAGPFGIMAQRLEQLGFPRELIQYIHGVATMEGRDFEKAVKSGELPSFDQVHKALMAAIEGREEQMPPLEQLEIALKQVEIQAKQAEIAKKGAEIAKENADTALIAEKIATERVEQQVKIRGLDFDEEKLAIERTKVVNELRQSLKVEEGKHSESKPGYQERGLKSDNK